MTRCEGILVLFGEGEAAGFVEGEDEDAGLGGLDDRFLREGFYGARTRGQLCWGREGGGGGGGEYEVG
jgi:hypothetical protein